MKVRVASVFISVTFTLKEERKIRSKEMQRSGKKYHMKMGNQGIIGGKLRLPTQSFPRYLVLPAPLLHPNPPAAPTLLSDTPFMQRLQSHQRKKIQT